MMINNNQLHREAEKKRTSPTLEIYF